MLARPGTRASLGVTAASALAAFVVLAGAGAAGLGPNNWGSWGNTPDQNRYLAGLPLVTEHAGATLVHSSPRSPEAWPYLISAMDGAAAFAAFATPLCFVGHSHMPAVWTLREDGSVDRRDVRDSGLRDRNRFPRTESDTILVGNVQFVGRLSLVDRLLPVQHQHIRLEVFVGRRPLKLVFHFPTRHF